jgi:hypothetical protein
MIVLAYPGTQCTNFHAAGWMWWFLRPFICSCVSGTMQFLTADQKQQRVSFVRLPPMMQSSCPGLSMVTRDGFLIMSLRQSNNPPNGKVQTYLDRKRRDKWEAKPRACLLFSLTSRGLLTKNSSPQAKQSIQRTTVTFYGGCVKMCKDFAPNFGYKRTGCCIMKTHPLTLPFSPGNFWPTTWL